MYPLNTLSRHLPNRVRVRVRVRVMVMVRVRVTLRTHVFSQFRLCTKNP